MARNPSLPPPYNFTDRIPPGQRRDRNGWYFRPEPRSFTVVASACDGTVNLTQVQNGNFTLWLYDRPTAMGSREYMTELFSRYDIPSIDTRGD